MKSHRYIGHGLAIAAALLLAALARADESLVLCDFQDDAALKAWDFNAGTPRLVQEPAIPGRKALEIAFDPAGPYQAAYMSWRRVRGDWSGYDALILDVFNPASEPVEGSFLVADRAWADRGGTYWNRHNATTMLAPGRTRWVISVGGLYRGEAGSRNNDIKRNIDVNSIVRVDFGFGAKGATGRIVLESLRLVKVSRPAGIWAFDFGPPDQSVMPGWTPVSNETRYSKERGFGWGPAGGTPWDGAARDTTFGPALIRNFCEAGGYNFHVDVPPGRYRVMVIYENSGYWSGEQAQHRERRILANGREAWSEKRPDGPAHALYRFEEVEPVGADIWDMYMAAELARPALFEAEAAADGITFRFEADRVWGSKVSALALHAADDAKSEQWLREQLDELAREFRSMAVCLDRPAAAFDVPPDWAKLGLVAWPVLIEDEVTPNSTPVFAEVSAGKPAPAPKSPGDIALTRLAARGEHESFCLALRPLRDLGECRLELEPLTGPAALPAQVQVVWYNTSRGFGNIAYRVKPHTLRIQDAVALPKDVTRELIATVRVPEDAPAGVYSGALVLKDAQGNALLRAPLRLDVRPVTLDRRTDFLMGFFGLTPPELIPEERRWDVLEETLAMLRDHGMNAVSGGPDWRLKGWSGDEPVIDFGEMDRFFALLRKYGFDKPLNGYGGARFLDLHEGYEKGAAGAKVEKESGLAYPEALMRAWRAVDAHARAAQWPTILYAMCDETRVRDVAERELDFMRMMAKVSAAFPATVRTSGSYSVSFRQRPDDPSDLLHWHQRFFEALDISSLNEHDETVMAEAQRLGKEVQIYNQGTSRYSFGLYQWSEYRKGVRARWQWHLNILHGYQFFDLDGREPDTAMICYGRKAIYPTIEFERCRQGAEDFYLYQTLWSRIGEARRAGGNLPAADAATALLENAVSGIRLDQTQPPPGYDAEALKAKVISAIENLEPVGRK
ncbi:MAG: hypothetical protein ABSA67_09985 [Candidatus Brocadiia bacterium]|jgi:hypothetical protein